MEGTTTFLVLLAGAVSLGAVHSLAPDHWLPFSLVARAQRWSHRRTACVTLLCGFGHVTASALLGLFALLLGLEVLTWLGGAMERVAGLLLVVFGLLYAAWGLRQAAGAHLHGHVHHHYDHIHDPQRMTVWALFLLFSADPCVAVMPLLFAAAPLGWAPALAIILAYEVATIAAMEVLTLLALRGVQHVRLGALERYDHAFAGVLIALVGVIVGSLGL